MRRLSISLLLGVLAPVIAHANGRFPGTSTINFRRGSTQDIAVGVTFGLVITHDGGATWHWMCERAVGYGGIYDPQYAYRASGGLLATTYSGLRDNRDGCTFATTALDATYVPQITTGPTGTLLAAASDPADARLYHSTDDGASFQVLSAPGVTGDQWDSLVAAPSGNRVYLTGRHPSGSTGSTPLLLRSTDGGATFASVPQAGLVTTAASQLAVVGLSPTDPDVVYLRATFEYGNTGDGLYVMNTATGTSWTRIHDSTDPFAFVVRSTGELVVAAPTTGAQHSLDGGTSWQPLAGAPHISCLAESPQHAVWACTQNYSSTTVPGDGFGLMKSSDLATWSGVLRYEDIIAPQACTAGTPQKDECDDGMWCPLRMQLSITADPSVCGVAGDPPVPPKAAGGCCNSGRQSGGAVPMALLVLGALCRRRRASRDRR